MTQCPIHKIRMLEDNCYCNTYWHCIKCYEEKNAYKGGWKCEDIFDYKLKNKRE